jgi:hypothetical protein
VARLHRAISDRASQVRQVRQRTVQPNRTCEQGAKAVGSSPHCPQMIQARSAPPIHVGPVPSERMPHTRCNSSAISRPVGVFSVDTVLLVPFVGTRVIGHDACHMNRPSASNRYTVPRNLISSAGGGGDAWVGHTFLARQCGASPICGRLARNAWDATTHKIHSLPKDLALFFTCCRYRESNDVLFPAPCGDGVAVVVVVVVGDNDHQRRHCR